LVSNKIITLKKWKKLNVVSWSRASADQSLHYHGVSLSIAILHFNFIIDFAWVGGTPPFCLHVSMTLMYKATKFETSVMHI